MFIDQYRVLNLIYNLACTETTQQVKKYNDNIFGALILDKKTEEIICQGTNKASSISPLYHGEITTLLEYDKFNSKAKPQNCIFVCSHKPCSMCLSALIWYGFKEVYYVFDYTETKRLFNMPLDEDILKEVFSRNDIVEDNNIIKLHRIIPSTKREKNLYSKLLKQYILLTNIRKT